MYSVSVSLGLFATKVAPQSALEVVYTIFIYSLQMQRMGHWGSFMDPFCHRPCLRMQLVHIYSVHARLRGQKTVVIQELYLL